MANPAAVAAVVLLGIVAPGLLILASQSTQVTAPAGFVLAAAALAADGRGPELGRSIRAGAATPLGIAFCLLMGWIAVSALWAPRPLYSLGVAGQIALVAATAAVGLAAVPAAAVARAGLWLAAGVTLAAVLAAVELRLDAPLRTLTGAMLSMSRLNHAVIAVAVLVWPAALALSARGWRWAAAGLYALVVAVTLVSVAQASVLGILAGTVAFALAWLLGRAAVWLVTAAMVALVAATPVLMERAGDLIPGALHSVLKASAWERVQIWHRFAEAVSDRWLAGYGLQASRHLAEVRPIELLPAETFNPLTAGHTHNAVLQVWVELGAVGAALLAVVLVLVGRLVAALPGATRAFALAAFASLFAVAYVSHGAWQVWWLATIALVAVWMRVTVREAGSVQAGSPSR
ncbi:O-antigen ligase family protein [Blastochloris viridis]|uniref:O-antigen ligase family protein n=1 Tax=Blastochloris viridis TaxID=1079 RepID=UPI0011AAB256|nr:O-antigen ligase family protein [Blastochloris viridis]